ncbi:glycosyltransferase family 4 protein [Halobacteriovorax sp. XZX-3]|uniref:glycosyltransferase family 4 protein n=1 Tax=unclassified Halobacteriovorax TaxID=2639665 RepID=UPI003713EE00
MKNEKVILAASDTWYLANFRFDLIVNLMSLYDEVILVTGFDGYEKKLLKKFNNLKLINSNLDRKSTGILKNLFLIFTYIKIYIKEKPDVVINFTIKPNVFSALVCILLRIPFVNNVTGLGTVFIKGGVLQKFVVILYRFLFPFAKKVIFQNQDDLNLIRSLNVPYQNFMLIEGSGVNTEVFKPSINIEDRIYDFVFIGRILKDKGVVEYIDAMKKLLTINSQLKVLIIGDLDSSNKTGLSEEELKILLDKSEIQYLGKSNDIPDVLNNTKFMVLPSYREGLSKVLIEAASMGCVILTSDVPGCRQVVDSNGFLFRERDSSSLYDIALRAMKIENSELIELSQNSRLLATNRFSTDIINQKIISLLQN